MTHEEIHCHSERAVRLSVHGENRAPWRNLRGRCDYWTDRRTAAVCRRMFCTPVMSSITASLRLYKIIAVTLIYIDVEIVRWTTDAYVVLAWIAFVLFCSECASHCHSTRMVLNNKKVAAVATAQTTSN